MFIENPKMQKNYPHTYFVCRHNGPGTVPLCPTLRCRKEKEGKEEEREDREGMERKGKGGYRGGVASKHD